MGPEEGTTATAVRIDTDPSGPIQDELARAYSAIATLTELTDELDRRTYSVQQMNDRAEYASPEQAADDPVPLCSVARAVREQSDQVEQISNRVRTILSALQT